jgi:hypothetical protein
MFCKRPHSFYALLHMWIEGKRTSRPVTLVARFAQILVAAHSDSSACTYPARARAIESTVYSCRVVVGKERREVVIHQLILLIS